MEILVTICGRAGSRGIKNKNVRKFLGYPLSYYTLAAIDLYRQQSQEDDIDVVLSTDSDELIEITEQNPFFGVDIIRRTKELSGDQVAKKAVIFDCLQRMRKQKGKQYGMVLDLDLTSPLRQVVDISRLIEKEKETKADVTFSVTNARRNPYFNMVIAVEKGVKKVLDSDFVTRQEAPDIYDMNASMYAYQPEYLEKESNVLDGYCEMILMEDTGVLDLDHEGDFCLMEVIAKYLFENKVGFREIFQHVRDRQEKGSD